SRAAATSAATAACRPTWRGMRPARPSRAWRCSRSTRTRPRRPTTPRASTARSPSTTSGSRRAPTTPTRARSSRRRWAGRPREGPHQAGVRAGGPRRRHACPHHAALAARDPQGARGRVAQGAGARRAPPPRVPRRRARLGGVSPPLPHGARAPRGPGGARRGAGPRAPRAGHAPLWLRGRDPLPSLAPQGLSARLSRVARASALVLILAGLLGATPAGAEHEVYYRYVVLGFMTDARGRPLAGRPVELVPRQDGVLVSRRDGRDGLLPDRLAPRRRKRGRAAHAHGRRDDPRAHGAVRPRQPHGRPAHAGGSGGPDARRAVLLVPLDADQRARALPEGTMPKTAMAMQSC